MQKYLILAINPGSTSTKIAVFENQTPLFVENITHSALELEAFVQIADQFDFRKAAILETLAGRGIALSDLDVIVGRGGLIHPVASGVYRVNEAMLADLTDSPIGSHASNLGGLIAYNLACEVPGSVEAYIADPVVVDEMQDVARITGLPQIRRRSIFHALNQKAVSRHYAASVGREYEQMNLIVAHLGGGISVGAHRQGQVVDVNNALDGDGPFTPERAGSLPIGDLVSLCFSGDYSKAQIRKMIKGEGGLVAHLGTNSAKEAITRAEAGSEHAMMIVSAMCYNVAKAIGQLGAVLRGQIDAIIITGGIAYSPFVCSYISDMVEFMAPVVVIPGEDEMSALAMNGLMVLEGRITPRDYERAL